MMTLDGALGLALFDEHNTPDRTALRDDFIREADLSLVSSQNDGSHTLSSAWAAFCQALLASNELRYVD